MRLMKVKAMLVRYSCNEGYSGEQTWLRSDGGAGCEWWCVQLLLTSIAKKKEGLQETTSSICENPTNE